MSRLSLLILATLIFIAAACTRNPDSESVQVPTLAQISTEMPTTVATPIVLIVTATPVPVTPSATNTLLPAWTPTAVQSTIVAGLPTMTPRVPGDLSGWIVLTQTSPFDNNVTVGAARDADSPVQAWLSNPTPTLFFRCKQRVFDIFIQIGASLENPPDLMDQVHVKLRYDQEPTIDAVMNTLNTNEDGAGFLNPGQTLKDMLTHKKLAFGFTPYNAAFTYTTFTLDGLEIALQPVLEACKIPDPVSSQ